MNYNKALDLILKKQSLGILPGLERVFALLEKMGNPQDKIKVIHIAGTNGKGTVSACIADSLTKSGYITGLFTSPWVLDYREQIQIDGQFISENDFAYYVEKYKDNECSEFEFLCAVMYKYFCDKNVDYAVVECGMGGLEDATNVISTPAISVITSVALDHTAFLGDTLEKIACHKSGIIKKNRPCVLYPNPDCEKVFSDKCSALGSSLYKILQQGSYMKNNIKTAKTALSLLGVDTKKICMPQLPARQQIIGNIMIDGAHNVDGALALKSNLPGGKITALVGMMKDKNVDGYLSVIAPLCSKIIAVTPSNPRSMSCRDLADIAKKYCANTVSSDSIPYGLELLKQEDGFLLICGSFYLARDIINLI